MARDNQPHAGVDQGNEPRNARRVNKTRGGEYYREYKGNISLLFPVSEQNFTTPQGGAMAPGLSNVGAQNMVQGLNIFDIDGDTFTPIFNNAAFVAAGTPFIRFFKNMQPISDWLPLAQVSQGPVLVPVPVSPSGVSTLAVVTINGTVSYTPPPWIWPTYRIAFDRVVIAAPAVFQFQALLTKDDADYLQ